MEDQDTTGQPAETDDIGTPTGNEESASAPAATDTGQQPEPEATPAPESAPEPAKPSIDDVPLETLLEREDVKRWGQSIGDRAAARAETRLKEQVKKTEAAAKKAAEEAERKKLIENEEFDELGRMEAAKSEAQERLLDSLELAGQAISQATTERYARELGEEAVERIVGEVNSKGGNVVDLTTALAEEATKRAVSKATGEAIAEVEKRFDEKLEARLTDAGVKQRSEEAETTGPVEKVSGAQPEPTGSSDDETYESMSEKYGRGEVSWPELEPYKKAHDKERGV